MIRCGLFLLLLFSAPANAQEWLSPWGVSGLQWLTDVQPLDALPRRQDFFLPDAQYIGRSYTDKPVDFRVQGPKTERRVMRYVHGQLVSAWLVREGPIDATAFATSGQVQWAGPALGPAGEGWRAVGEATSWSSGNRTSFHWRDRLGDREVLASRAVARTTYGIRRATQLKPDFPSQVMPRVTGQMKKQVKDARLYLSGCLQNSPKPVRATVQVQYNEHGQLARIRVDTDQPAVDIENCFAASIIDVEGPANSEGTFTVYRFR